jgi:thioredoxin 1
MTHRTADTPCGPANAIPFAQQEKRPADVTAFAGAKPVGPASIMSIDHATDATFEQQVLKSDTPVLVDYWAAWCGPCKMIAPVLDEIARDYAGRLRVVKVNVDENQSVPARYGIRGIPTLMLFRDGAVLDTKVGAVSRSQLASFLDNHI